MGATPPPCGHLIKEFFCASLKSVCCAAERRKAHCAFHRKICWDIANFSSRRVRTCKLLNDQITK